MFSTSVFGKTTVFLSSAKAIHELIEKRSLNYSDRPSIPLLSIVYVTYDTYYWGSPAHFFSKRSDLSWDYGFLPYGDEWKTHRKLFMSKFGIAPVKKYRPCQAKVVPRLLKRLLKSPDAFVEHYKL